MGYRNYMPKDNQELDNFAILKSEVPSKNVEVEITFKLPTQATPEWVNQFNEAMRANVTAYHCILEGIAASILDEDISFANLVISNLQNQLREISSSALKYAVKSEKKRINTEFDLQGEINTLINTIQEEIHGDDISGRLSKEQPDFGYLHIKNVEELSVGDSITFYYNGGSSSACKITKITNDKLYYVRNGREYNTHLADYGLIPYGNGKWNPTNHIKRG